MNNEDPWKKLKSFTSARVALGSAGGSLTTNELLDFRKDHALARDAVWAELDSFKLADKLGKISLQSIQLHSNTPDRETYIKRPDLGRVLAPSSVEKLKALPPGNFDLSIIVADGLSALAIERHAIEFLKIFTNLTPYKIAPIAIVKQGRVAISDHIGSLLNSKLTVMLIGERPGLTSPDSLGIYMTYNPQQGNTDEKRNCISNIRKEGLSYSFAAQKLDFLVSEALRRKISGVYLKDTFNDQLLDNDKTKR